MQAMRKKREYFDATTKLFLEDGFGSILNAVNLRR